MQTVAKTLLGDILHLNFVVDPRVQGNVTLVSASPVPRKDVLAAFEGVLRMSNAAIVHSGNLVKIVPIPEASGGAISAGAGEPGFGVSLVPLRYTSASTVAKTAENFLSRPGAIRVVQSRNLLLIQGTIAERQAVLDVVSTFDVEWLQSQSVGVYPLKSTSPETMIGELERVFEANEGGAGQGVIRFQPVSRMNAVMVVTKNPKLLAQTTQWVQRLDRSDMTGTTLRTYRLKNGNATQVARILSDIFGQRSAGSADGPTKQIAPGVDAAPSQLDSLDRGSSSGNPGASTVLTTVVAIESRPPLRRSRIKRAVTRTRPTTPPIILVEARNADAFRICESRRMPQITRSWSIPIRRIFEPSSALYETSTDRNCRYRSKRRLPRSH